MLFKSNLKRQQISINDEDLCKLFIEAVNNYSKLPLYLRGQSKEIRHTSYDGILIQKLIPSLSSITERRKGFVEGTDKIRNDISTIFIEILHNNSIQTCYLAKMDDYMLITEEKVPPIEVIVKAALIGTPAKIYHNIFNHIDRYGNPLVFGEMHQPYVRFDYRNPLLNEDGDFLRDECLPIALADRFINVGLAEENALKVFEIIQSTLNQINMQVLDCCLSFDEHGKVLCYEISPDNMRIKTLEWNIHSDSMDDFDKDLWRNGSDSKLILSQWEYLKNKLGELK